jgi:hypothetical protein
MLRATQAARCPRGSSVPQWADLHLAAEHHLAGACRSKHMYCGPQLRPAIRDSPVRSGRSVGGVAVCVGSLRPSTPAWSGGGSSCARASSHPGCGKSEPKAAARNPVPPESGTAPALCSFRWDPGSVSSGTRGCCRGAAIDLGVTGARRAGWPQGRAPAKCRSRLQWRQTASHHPAAMRPLVAPRARMGRHRRRRPRRRASAAGAGAASGAATTPAGKAAASATAAGRAVTVGRA